MFDKLDALARRYDELTNLLGNQAVLADVEMMRTYAKEQSELRTTATKYHDYLKVRQELEENQALLASGTLDNDFAELVHEEIASLTARQEALEDDLRVLLLPRDPHDDRGVIIEIRAGTGGDEAALFAMDLFRMYSRYAETQRWRVEIMSASPTETGGFKEVVASIDGKEVYSKLKFEKIGRAHV